MKSRTELALIVGVLFTLCTPLTAQEFRGRINGVVTDNTSAVVPGATVTAAGPALIQPQTTITGADGNYRFPALPAGVYTLTFQLPGFQKITRENIRVVINTTLTVDAQLTVATLQESVTVSGRITHRRHVDDDDRHELHQGTADRDSERARHLGGNGAGARVPGDRIRRRGIAHRHADGLRDLRRQPAEHDAHRRGEHERRRERERGLLRLRFVRGVPARWRRQHGRPGRARRVAEHYRQIGRQPLHGIVVQRLRKRQDDHRQRAGTSSGPVSKKTTTGSSRARRAD